MNVLLCIRVISIIFMIFILVFRTWFIGKKRLTIEVSVINHFITIETWLISLSNLSLRNYNTSVSYFGSITIIVGYNFLKVCNLNNLPLNEIPLSSKRQVSTNLERNNLSVIRVIPYLCSLVFLHEILVNLYGIIKNTHTVNERYHILYRIFT